MKTKRIPAHISYFILDMTNRDHPYIEPDGLQTPESIQCERKHVQEKPPGRQPMKRLLSEKKVVIIHM